MTKFLPILQWLAFGCRAITSNAPFCLELAFAICISSLADMPCLLLMLEAQNSRQLLKRCLLSLSCCCSPPSTFQLPCLKYRTLPTHCCLLARWLLLKFEGLKSVYFRPWISFRFCFLFWFDTLNFYRFWERIALSVNGWSSPHYCRYGVVCFRDICRSSLFSWCLKHETSAKNSPAKLAFSLLGYCPPFQFCFIWFGSA